uniref:Uncharacterized protein n=2 Tax=Cucumis melo TaxID=3656 RepID=A0A9I9E3Q9_CUCME
MPRTQFSRPGGKKRSPDGFFPLLRMVVSLSIFGARAPRTSTHTPG